MGQFGNSQQVVNPSGFPGNAQYPTLPQQPSQFPNNNNNNSGQFQGKGGSSQYPRGPAGGGYPGGQFPVGAGQVSSAFLFSECISMSCQMVLYCYNHHHHTHYYCHHDHHHAQYPRGPVPYPASEGGQGPSSKYLDEVRFPPKVRQHAD